MRENTHIDRVLFFTTVCKLRQRRSHMNSKSTIKSLTALTMAGAMVFSMNTMPVSAAKKKTKAKSTVKSVKVVAPS